jgi:hypothetical protein
MRLTRSLIGLASVALLSPCLEAQVLYGTLLGNITDPSQSAVPKAVVTATNKSTGLASTRRGTPSVCCPRRRTE